jgi:hypothetical protein
MMSKVKSGRVFGHMNARGELYLKGDGVIGSRKVGFLLLPKGKAKNGSPIYEVFITDVASERYSTHQRLSSE